MSTAYYGATISELKIVKGVWPLLSRSITRGSSVAPGESNEKYQTGQPASGPRFESRASRLDTQ